MIIGNRSVYKDKHVFLYMLFPILLLSLSWHFSVFIIPGNRRSRPYGRFYINTMMALSDHTRKNGIPSVVMVIHTFREFQEEKFHSHIHARVMDWLFTDNVLFHVMKRVYLKPLEELFKTKVFKFLKKGGKIADELINKLNRRETLTGKGSYFGLI